MAKDDAWHVDGIMRTTSFNAGDMAVTASSSDSVVNVSCKTGHCVKQDTFGGPGTVRKILKSKELTGAVLYCLGDKAATNAAKALNDLITSCGGLSVEEYR